MPKAFFRPAERNLLLTHFDDWQGLAGSGTQRDEDGNLFNAKDNLIDDIIQELFERFPERDLAQSPNGPDVISQEDRDRLHTRVKELLYNESRKDHKGKTEQVKVKKQMRKISVDNLFKQRYNDRIVARRDILETSRDPAKRLRAYNAAVSYELQAFKEQSPDEYDDLKTLVEEMKEASGQDFDGQPAEIQEANLAMFPADIIATIREWERKTGAAIYIMSVWPKPGGAAVFFDYASKNCGRFTESDVAAKMLKLWTSWMDTHRGSLLASKPSEAPPSVYPMANGMPLLPELDMLNLGILEEKRLIRRYLTCRSLAAGGTIPSWKAIEERGSIQPGAVVELARMPKGMPILKDMKVWRRAELDNFISHILRGQRKQIPDSQIFQWREVPGKRGSHVRVAAVYEPGTHPDSNLKYTKLEKLYAQRIENEQGSTEEAVLWNGLPLARTTHVYATYSVVLYNELLRVHADEQGMIQLIQSVARMEQYGPIHRVTGLSDDPRTGSAHIPQGTQPSLAHSLSPAALLPLPFFDRLQAGATAWSLPTLLAWITIQHPYIDPESSTVYGGPTGVRNVVFGLSRVLQSVSLVESGQNVSDPIRRVTRGTAATWSAPRALALARECIVILQRQILKSITILEVTFVDRSNAWEAAIEEQYGRWHRAGEPNQVTPVLRGVDATSGVPTSIQAVSGIRRILEMRVATRQDPDETVEASRVLCRSNSIGNPARYLGLSESDEESEPLGDVELATSANNRNEKENTEREDYADVDSQPHGPVLQRISPDTQGAKESLVGQAGPSVVQSERVTSSQRIAENRTVASWTKKPRNRVATQLSDGSTGAMSREYYHLPHDSELSGSTDVSDGDKAFAVRNMGVKSKEAVADPQMLVSVAVANAPSRGRRPLPKKVDTEENGEEKDIFDRRQQKGKIVRRRSGRSTTRNPRVDEAIAMAKKGNWQGE